MRKFKITVNGKEYEVSVEEVGGGASPAVVAAPAPAPAPAPVKAEPAPAAPKAATAAAPAAKPKPTGGKDGLISAPMPGTISEILVQEGQQVKKGQVLIMLEAMKMQNEIMSPCDAAVASVHTSKGASVNTGDPLITLAK
ncbi:MAG: biotin/lipoyl-binding protein [Firmicutes bacterium]|nr:biotin/lipoyl-binding protein [Bacillota bacterium]